MKKGESMTLCEEILNLVEGMDRRGHSDQRQTMEPTPPPAGQPERRASPITLASEDPAERHLVHADRRYTATTAFKRNPAQQRATKIGKHLLKGSHFTEDPSNTTKGHPEGPMAGVNVMSNPDKYGPHGHYAAATFHDKKAKDNSLTRTERNIHAAYSTLHHRAAFNN